MDSLDRDTLSTLAQYQGWPSVTINMPTHRAGADKEQDRIRFKNLLRSAEEQIRAHDVRSADVDSVMRPARELLDDAAFWRDTGDGLALFFSADGIHTYKLDRVLPEDVVVSERFVIRPVLPALAKDTGFFVLTLSKNRVRLLEGTSDGLAELELGSVPESLAEALKYDDYERNVQFHTRTPASAAGRGGRRTAVFHGHGGVPDTEKSNLERYFKSIDRGIQDLMRDTAAPLLLAGVDYLTAMYRDLNSYAHLVDETLSGNPDETPLHELHARSREMLEPFFRGQVDREVAAFETLAGTAGASSDLAQIVAAASEGRVRVLLLDQEATAWGRYDPSSGSVDVSPDPRPGDWDLADLAAAETLLHGGTVHSVDPDDAPAQAAAIFRY